MFKPYYKFIDKNHNVSYIRSTKSALKTINKFPDEFIVTYVYNKGISSKVIYCDRVLEIELYSKNQIKYCKDLFYNKGIILLNKTKLKFYKKPLTKYQLRKRILKFNNSSEHNQHLELFYNAKNLNIGFPLEEIIQSVIAEYKGRGAVIKNESYLYL